MKNMTLLRVAAPKYGIEYRVSLVLLDNNVIEV